MKNTVSEIKKAHRQKIAQLKQELLEEDVRWTKKIEKAEEFGGFIDRPGIIEFLGISNPRVSVLIGRGEFRQCQHGFSFTDVKRYSRSRRPGRPKKGRKHLAEQFELPINNELSG